MDLLHKTIENNPALIRAATIFHQSGAIPADTYVIDLDMVRSNSEKLYREATKNGLTSYICAKQFGRNPLVCKAIMNSGIREAMAHDIEGAKNLHRHGIPVKHLGHFGQVPTSELRYVLEKIKPDVITVFSVEKAKQISEMASPGSSSPIHSRAWQRSRLRCRSRSRASNIRIDPSIRIHRLCSPRDANATRQRDLAVGDRERMGSGAATVIWIGRACPAHT